MRRDQKPVSAGAAPSEVTLVHLFRGELARSDRWRTRLDTTSNWALTTTAAVVSFGFASPSSPHVTFLVGIWLVMTFLFVEARRYRYYDLWNRRVRLIEEGFLAPLLRQEPNDPDALRELASEMERPQLSLSLVSALATRLTRMYGSVLTVLLAAWLVKVQSHPTPAADLHELAHRAHVGPLPGWLVLLIMGVFCVALLALYLTSYSSRAPLGELKARRRRGRLPLWEQLSRPYLVQDPRRHLARERPPSPPTVVD